MKQIKSFILALLLIFTFTSYTFASNQNQHNLSQIYKNNDGSYIIVNIITIESKDSYNANSSMSTKSGTKNYSFYNSKSELQWIVSIHGTFNYNGSTSNCIKSSTSSQLINSTWKVKEAVASRKNNSAIGDFVVKHYMLGVPVQTKDVQLTLTCSPNGTLS